MNHKYALLLVIAVSIIVLTSVPIFGQSLGMSITATADRNSDTITVTGKTVSYIEDVTFRVTSPSGDKVLSIVKVSPDYNGEFMVKFIVGPTWTEDGFYGITAMQSVTANSLYTLKVLVEVNDGMTEKTSVTESNLDTGIIVPNVTTRDAETINLLKTSEDKPNNLLAFGDEYTINIPPWVKGVANFWVEDKIDDGEFAEALEFLIDSDIIQLDSNIIQLDSIVIVPEQEIDWEEKYNVLLKQNNSNEQHYLEKNKKIIDDLTAENDELKLEVKENHHLAQEEESKLKEKIKELEAKILKLKGITL